jgi:hypothetical protein
MCMTGASLALLHGCPRPGRAPRPGDAERPEAERRASMRSLTRSGPGSRLASAALTMIASSTTISWAVAMASSATPRRRPLSRGAGTLHTDTPEQFAGAPGALAGSWTIGAADAFAPARW